jgi:hypothetical protein
MAVPAVWEEGNKSSYHVEYPNSILTLQHGSLLSFISLDQHTANHAKLIEHIRLKLLVLLFLDRDVVSKGTRWWLPPQPHFACVCVIQHSTLQCITRFQTLLTRLWQTQMSYHHGVPVTYIVSEYMRVDCKMNFIMCRNWIHACELYLSPSKLSSPNSSWRSRESSVV